MPHSSSGAGGPRIRERPELWGPDHGRYCTAARRRCCRVMKQGRDAADTGNHHRSRGAKGGDVIDTDGPFAETKHRGFTCSTARTSTRQ